MRQKVFQGVRLSPQQKHLWLLQRDHPGGGAYCWVMLEGALRITVLERAVQAMVMRYEIFRTSFHRERGTKVPFQVIHDQCPLTWQHIDLCHFSLEQHEPEIQRLFDEQQSYIFDFETLSLLQLCLVEFSLQKHALIIRLPALCADAWTLKNLFREISSTYQVYCEDRDFSHEPVQYVQFSEWQNELLLDEDGDAGTAYWHRQDLSSSPPLFLPFERTRGEDTEPIRDELSQVIDPSLVEALERVARQFQVSVETVLLGSWFLLLWKMTGEQDLLLARVCDGRPYEELHESMGLFAKWLPFRYRISSDSRFGDVVSQIEALVKEGDTWQDQFVWDDDDERMQAMEANLFGFSYEQSPASIIAGDVSFTLRQHDVCFDRFKMKLSCVQETQGLRVRLTYDPDRFQRLAVQSLADQFETLLASVASCPDAQMDTFPILSEAARHRIVIDFNKTLLKGPDQACLHKVFETQSTDHPNQVAVVCQNESLTYTELNRRANQLAHYLRRHGVGPLSFVGLWVERSVEMIVGLLGILKAGAAYVPLDPGAPMGRLHIQLNQIGVSWLVTQEAVVSQGLDFPGTVLCLDRDRSQLDHESTDNLGHVLSPHSLAYVMYTSGSTGAPKGVACTHHNIMHYTSSVCQTLSIEAGWRFATVSTLSADLGNTVVFAALTSAGTLHIIPYETAMNGNMLSDYFVSHQIDVLKIVPSHLNALLGLIDRGTILPKKYLICGGEALSTELAKQIMAGSSECEVVNHYGPTETTIGSLFFPIQQNSWLERGWSPTVPIGRPLGHTEAYILDGQLEPVAVGISGELYLGGIGLAWGYINQPLQTAERFLPHPYSGEQGARLYRTGDLARFSPDDTIEFLGRRDQQVKLRGFRIELGEIEVHIGQIPGVREGVVIVREEDAGKEKSLVAYAVASGATSPTMSTVRDFLKERVPDYMVPSTVFFLDSLPLTSNGKVDRTALLTLEGTGLATEYVAPRNPTEELLAGIWTELLKRERVGIHDNFFDLGGHSLLAVQLLHHIQKAIGSELSLMTIFQSPTIASLSEVVLDALRILSSPLITLKAKGSRRPLYGIDSTGNHVLMYQPLAQALCNDQPVYGIQLHNIFTLAPQEISIAVLAKEYAKEIVQHQPEGPYHLLGWSLGGVIALAIAQALEELEQNVAFLGFLDTQTRLALYENSTPSLLEELGAFLGPEERNELLALPNEERQDLQNRLQAMNVDEQVDAVIRWAQGRGFFQADVSVDVIKGRYALLKDEALLMKSYQSQPIQAPIHVWWATKTLESQSGIPPIDWSCYTTGNVHCENIESDHEGLLTNPQVHQQIDAILAGLDHS